MLAPGIATAVPAASPTSGTFGDDNGSVHESAIESLAASGITFGCGLGAFCPSEAVTRGQLAAFLVRAIPHPAATTDHFIDDASSVFQGSINKLREAGHINGCNPPTNDRFCPDDSLTRGQLAQIMGSALNLRPRTQDLFVDDTGSVFERAINTFGNSGITRGCNPPSNDRFCPDDTVTRAQLASFITRALELPTVNLDVVDDERHPVVFSVAGLELRLPSSATELVGLHQSGHEGAQPITATASGPPVVTLPSRGRGTSLVGAADIVSHPGVEVRSPVSGTVLRARKYTLYCRYTDAYAVIEPYGRPGLEVKLLHITNLRVAPGDRVVAGRTVIAEHPTKLPFASQVDESSGWRDWPHVHIEVVDTSIPNTGGGSC